MIKEFLKHQWAKYVLGVLIVVIVGVVLAVWLIPSGSTNYLHPSQSTGLDKNMQSKPELKQQTKRGAVTTSSSRSLAADHASLDPNLIDWSDEDDEEKVPIYVIGAVRVPSLYRIGVSKLIGDAIALAGGATEDADLEVINLAAKIVAHQSIRVPTKEEVKQGLKTPPVGIAGSPSLPNGKKININTASADLLEELPGIGPMTAMAIVKYRTQHGPFKQIEDLMKLNGFKKSKFEPIQSFISVTD